MALITKDTVASLAITGTTSRKIKGKNQPDSKARWSVNATGSLTNDGDTAATEFSQLNVEVVGTLIHPTIRKDTGTYATIEVDQSSIDVLQAIQAKLIEYVGALGAADKIVDYGPANTKIKSKVGDADVTLDDDGGYQKLIARMPFSQNGELTATVFRIIGADDTVKIEPDVVFSSGLLARGNFGLFKLEMKIFMAPQSAPYFTYAVKSVAVAVVNVPVAKAPKIRLPPGMKVDFDSPLLPETPKKKRRVDGKPKTGSKRRLVEEDDERDFSPDDEDEMSDN